MELTKKLLFTMLFFIVCFFGQPNSFAGLLSRRQKPWERVWSPVLQ